VVLTRAAEGGEGVKWYAKDRIEQDMRRPASGVVTGDQQSVRINAGNVGARHTPHLSQAVRD
jgi:hypothetical protein